MKDDLTNPQIKLLTSLLGGPRRPAGGEWAAFYSLERKRCAIKDDMLVYITDVGRKILAESFERHHPRPKPDPTGCSD